MDLHQLTKEMGLAAIEAGQRVVALPHPKVSSKEGHANFVTTADVASQQFLVETLTPLLPDAHFLAEEDEIHILHPGYNWIIDPIDGTANFIRGCQCSAISVGLCLDQEMVAGVVYDPYRKELFAASKGNGATMNGEPIHAADRPIEESLIAIGTSPYYRDLIPKTFRTAQALFEVGGDLRRTGSAALDLCAVACGRYDAFFEATLSPWDYAASTIILQEAGAVIASLPAEQFALDHNVPIFAASKTLYPAMYRTALDAFLSKE